LSEEEENRRNEVATRLWVSERRMFDRGNRYGKNVNRLEGLREAFMVESLKLS
jgi:hypothetical protein